MLMARPAVNAPGFQFEPFQAQACGSGGCAVGIELLSCEFRVSGFAFAVVGEFLGWWFVVFASVGDVGI